MPITLELEARLNNLLATAQAETANIGLFAPIEEREECPICMIPQPIEEDEIRFMPCCGKNICQGCDFKHSINNIEKSVRVQRNEEKCAFCCQPHPKNIIKALKKLMKKNNPDAFTLMARCHKKGDGVLQSNTKALEIYSCS